MHHWPNGYVNSRPAVYKCPTPNCGTMPATSSQRKIQISQRLLVGVRIFLLRHHLHLDSSKYVQYKNNTPKDLSTNASSSSRPDDSQSLGSFLGAGWQESSGFQDAGITGEVGDGMDTGDGRTNIPPRAQECLGIVGLAGDRDANITSTSSLYQDVTNPTVGSMIDTNDYSSGLTNNSTDVALALAYLNRLTNDMASTSQATTSMPGSMFGPYI